MTISKTQFRILLVIYVGFVLLQSLSGTWTEGVIPDAVRQLEPEPPSTSLLLFLFGFFVVTICAGIAGFAGMFVFWPPARYIYLLAVILKLLCSPLIVPWTVETGWQSMFAELELLLDGVILTLSIVGPAKIHFIKKEEAGKAFETTV